MAKVKERVIKYYEFYCPGCKDRHYYSVEDNGSQWQFNGDVNNPTFTPSLLNSVPSIDHETGQVTEKSRCHLFITNGKIIYCGDCSHELAGQTIDLNESSL